MSSREIVKCDICGCKTNELYLSDIKEILCADCEADYVEQEKGEESDE